ncbi:MAG TPA: hypothetical protein DHU55_03415 [Blastocatellia bacterium]|jgi:hypothetical protein|nr:hypothetical protein [Blastocatellia bacterium]
MAGTTHNGNGHGHITETPDVSHIKNVDVTHEASDVNVGGILKFVLGLTIFAVFVQVLMWGMFRLLNAQEERKDPPSGPMAMTEQERRPPDPKLQAAPGFGVKLENGQWVPLENGKPQAEYRVLRGQWEEVLKEGVRDQSGKVVGLPIDQAMQQVVQNGLPSRVKEIPLEGPGNRAEDYGVDMPTAASSGRTTEKRRQ